MQENKLSYSNNDTVDLSLLEKDEDFRSELLHFILMLNKYIESIFWDYFDHSKKRNNKNLRKRIGKMKELAEDALNNGYIKNTHLYNSLTRNKRVPIDCLSEDFQKFLEHLPTEMKEGIFNKMAEEHAIFFPKYEEMMRISLGAERINEYFRNLIDVLETIRNKRNNLEHYKPNKTAQNTDDHKVIEALGMFLLPYTHNLLIGRMRHYCTKLNKEEHIRMTKTIKNIVKILEEERKKRRDNTEKLFSFVRSKENEKMLKNKTRRKALVNDNIEWREERRKTGMSAGEYREHQFRIRYYFMGRNNYRRIKELLGKDNGLSFRRDIEPLYILGTKINFILHQALYPCKKHIEEENERIAECYREKKGIGKNNKSFEKCKKEQSEKRLNKITTIRNPISHNTMFWDIKGDNGKYMEFRKVLSIAAKDIKRSGIKDPHKIINRMKSKLIDLFKNEKYSFVIEEENRLSKVKRWTEEKRKEYKKQRYTIHKRKEIKRLIGRWYRDAKSIAS